MRRFCAQIPNALSSSRIVLALIFPFVPDYWWLPILAGALLTEYLDGAISRKYHWESNVGQLLDPIADKILFGAVIITFVLHARLQPGHALLLATRDVIVILGAGWISLTHPLRCSSLKPLWVGKTTTVLQYSCLFYLALVPELPFLLTAVTAGVGAIAGGRYLYVFRFRLDPLPPLAIP